MPRLTDDKYLAYRAALRDDWYNHGQWTFAHLTQREQTALHCYFAPTDDFIAAEALEFRRRISKLQPSLPQVAGRAYRQAAMHLGHAPTPDPSAPPAKGKALRSKGKQSVKVAVVMQPKIDLKRLAKIYYDVITEIIRREEAEAAEKSPSKEEQKGEPT